MRSDRQRAKVRRRKQVLQDAKREPTTRLIATDLADQPSETDVDLGSNKERENLGQITVDPEVPGKNRER